ncbi:MAG: OmpA family protein [Candidatus Kapaibacterium sp.]
MNYIKLSVLLAFIFSFVSKAEESSSYGLFGAFADNHHSVAFNALPGIPNCCPGFNSGRGSGFSIGGLYSFSLTSKIFLEARAGYQLHNAKLEKQVIKVVSGSNYEPVRGTIEHMIDADISTFGLGIAAGYRLSSNFKFRAGFELGYIAGNRFLQRETIVDPENGAYFTDTGLPVRNSEKGDIPGLENILLSGVVGANFLFNLNRYGNFRGGPDISFQYGFNNILESEPWKINALRAGIVLEYKIERKEERIQQVIASDNYPPVERIAGFGENKKLVAYITDGQGNLTDTITRKIHLSKITKPLLNYIFFDHNDPEIPVRYDQLSSKEISNFTEDQMIGKGIINTYHHILDIIAYRLKQYPDSKIYLTGCNSNVNGEKGNIRLSAKRAQSVKEYFVNSWGIDSNRITTHSRNLPQLPSNPAEKDGIEENRRVEISSDTPGVLAPVVSNEKIIRYYPEKLFLNLYSPEDIDDWKVIVSGTGSVLASGSGGLPDYLEIDPGDIPFANTNVSIIAKAKIDSDELADTINMNLVINEEMSVGDDPLYKKFNLILFSFDDAKLDQRHLNIIDYIKSEIDDNSKLIIKGYTDRTGDKHYNKQLSVERAKRVSELLEAKEIQHEGLGEDEIYDNDLPEGRFYNRTVEIFVEPSSNTK